jgi:hypothetical protein
MPSTDNETTWENSRRFASRMMMAGVACFGLTLVLFPMGFLFNDGFGAAWSSAWADTAKITGAAAVVLFKIGVWMRFNAPHDDTYEDATEHFVSVAAKVEADLRAAIARNDAAYPHAERILRNVEKWIHAAQTDTLPPGPRNGLGLEKSGLDFGAATQSLQALEAAYNAIPHS